MPNEDELKLIDDILSDWEIVIGSAFTGYKNHVIRMASFCFAIRDCSEDEKRKIIIAACFHDIGIWAENTLDYLPSSVPPALKYLSLNQHEQWSEEITLMITEHHKLHRHADSTICLVELFRQGDLVDFSLGALKFGIPSDYIKTLKAQYPNGGFHIYLLKLAARRFIKNPLNPAPMIKW